MSVSLSNKHRNGCAERKEGFTGRSEFIKVAKIFLILFVNSQMKTENYLNFLDLDKKELCIESDVNKTTGKTNKKIEQKCSKHSEINEIY